MLNSQSSLGSRKIHRVPDFNVTHIGRVTKISDYESLGRIEVMFLDYGISHPVWVVGSIERKPVLNDLVLIGYINGRKDSPYLAGYVMNASYTTNFITIEENRIKIQLPIVDKQDDVDYHLTNDDNQDSRAYIILDSDGLTIHHPTGDITLSAPNGHIKKHDKHGQHNV